MFGLNASKPLPPLRQPGKAPTYLAILLKVDAGCMSLSGARVDCRISSGIKRLWPVVQSYRGRAECAYS